MSIVTIPPRPLRPDRLKNKPHAPIKTSLSIPQIPVSQGIVSQSPASQMREKLYHLVQGLSDQEISNLFSPQKIQDKSPIANPQLTRYEELLKAHKQEQKNINFSDCLEVIHRPLSEKTQNSFFALSDQHPSPYKTPDDNAKIFKNFLLENLSQKTQSSFTALKGQKKAILLLNNTPFKDSTQKKENKKNIHSENFVLGLSKILSMPAEQGSKESNRSNIVQLNRHYHNGSNDFRENDLRTYSSFLLNSPDYHIIQPLHGEGNVKIQLLPLSLIMQNLSQKSISILKQKEFNFTSQDGNNKNTDSILRLNDNGNYEIKFHPSPGHITAISPRAKKAFEQLKDAVNDLQGTTPITLRSGNILIIDNKAALCRIINKKKPVITDDNNKFSLQHTFVTNHIKPFHFNMYAFKDAKDRYCHEIIPKNKAYNNVTDFAISATKSEKLDLLDSVKKLTKNVEGYRFILENDPVTRKLRMYVAIATDPNMRDSRWEEGGVHYQGKPADYKNNPLYEKALEELPTTQASSNSFILFKNKKPGRDLIVPKQKYVYRDIQEFINKSTESQKLEFFDMLAKHAEIDNKVYINGGKCRHIPWLHIQLLKGEKNIYKRI